MTDIDEVCAEWIRAKQEETAANKRRVALEKQIAGLVEVPDEGSKTHSLDNYKVTVSQPVTRKVDPRKWASVMDHVPREMRPVKNTLSADGAGCKWMAKEAPEMWAKIAEAFEVKPGKIGVKVEAVANGD